MKTIFRSVPAFTIDQRYVRLSAARPVRWERLTVETDVRPHDHEFTEICLVLEGGALHVTETGGSPVRPGSVLVMPPGAVHSFREVRGMAVVNVYFLAEWFLPELRLESASQGLVPLFFPQALRTLRESPHPLEMEIPPPIQAMVLRELRDLDEPLRGSSPLWVTCCFLKFLQILAESYHTQALPAAAVPGPLPALVWRAFPLVDRAVQGGEKLDLQVLAGSLGVTRDHLGRVFAQHVGEPPQAFYQRRRLQFVCRALLSPHVTLAEIAHRFAFSDEAHMSRMFKTEFALTPGAYRRKFVEENTSVTAKVGLLSARPGGTRDG